MSETKQLHCAVYFLKYISKTFLKSKLIHKIITQKNNNMKSNTNLCLLAEHQSVEFFSLFKLKDLNFFFTDYKLRIITILDAQY